MAVIGNVPSAGASVILNLDYLPERILLEGPGSVANFSSFSVVTSGVQLMSITSAARFEALAKFDNQLISTKPTATEDETRVLKYLRLAIGRINKQTTIQGTDSNPTILPTYPYNIMAASTGMSGLARRAVESSINPSANATFNDFEALFIEPSNFLRSQITFDNGFTDEYTPQEVASLFAAYNQSDVQGSLGNSFTPLICLAGDTPFGRVSQAVLYATSGGSVTVLKSDYVSL